MAYIFLIGFGIAIALRLLQKLQDAETGLLVLTLKWTFVAVLVLAGAYLTLVGRLFHVALIGVFLFILLQQDARQWVKRKPLALPSPSKTKKKRKKETE